ncbi:FAD-binding domain-containing protein [Delitschia confertaspora ATCC 74209]|uniref:FAD-binding domain-containing protein n=1 Tax=Delitschia confertaspora ATCC 74209 TaxID=1513339 RepID=A0A9P4JGJ6_9PLEO|nr:FAD-binding domain-containing protein [Delitschia confertaspora ATCC 74209]
MSGLRTVILASLCSATFAQYIVSNDSSISRILGPRLTSNARIILPGDVDFSSSSERWQEYAKPTFKAIVEVTTESDISETIIYANERSIPFLAVANGHGTVHSLGGFQHGIGIRLHKMNKIQFTEDGTHVTIGGGASNGDVLQALKAANKQTSTGVCECTGFVGPALGGGHGLLEGHYGMMVDNIIDALVVLANGSVVTVSNEVNNELFWALRGAGHNFGIIPSIRYKVHTPEALDWNYTIFMFSGNKLEQVYETMNDIVVGRQQNLTKMINYAVWMRNPELDPVNPVILFGILYPTSDSHGPALTASFHDFGPLSVQSGQISYWDLPELTGNGKNSAICQRGMVHMKFPIYLDKYNTTALRSAYNEFNLATSQVPAFKDTILLFEAYSLSNVPDTIWTNTAFPWRNARALVTPVITYQPDKRLDDTAIQFGASIRQLLYQGSNSHELRAYVNYAFGDERPEQLYGNEPWRLTRLHRAKEQYDPNNRFRWYAPIIR